MDPLRDNDLVVSGIGTVVPPPEAADESWFDHRVELGRRSYKYLPRSGQYVLAAAKRALADAGTTMATVPEERRAVAIGCNNATARIQDEFDRTVLEHGADLLSPASAAYFSVNLVAGRVAMEHAARGFSLAMHSPTVAGLEAMQCGLRAVARGRADVLLAGATEEPLPPAEPAARRSADGAVVLYVERARAVADRDGRWYGRCTVRGCYLSPDLAGGLARARQVVAASIPGPAEPLPVRLVAEASPLADAVADCLAALGYDPVLRLPTRAGCLDAVGAVADALRTGTGPCLVVGCAAEGNVTLTRIDAGGAERGRAVPVSAEVAS
jgi:3-oxoacyl-[acyl-carrier-protein] synthase II